MWPRRDRRMPGLASHPPSADDSVPMRRVQEGVDGLVDYEYRAAVVRIGLDALMHGRPGPVVAVEVGILPALPCPALTMNRSKLSRSSTASGNKPRTVVLRPSSASSSAMLWDVPAWSCHGSS